jgi:hypothetical protein
LCFVAQCENSIGALFSNPIIKYASFYAPWEESICWDDAKAAASSHYETNKRLRRLFPQNSAVDVGEWVQGIVWDDSVIEVTEGGYGRGVLDQMSLGNLEYFSRLVDTSSSSRCMPAAGHDDYDSEGDSDSESLYIHEIDKLEDAYAFLKPGAAGRMGGKDGLSVDEADSSQQEGRSKDAMDEDDNDAPETLNPASQLPGVLPQRLTTQQKLDKLERDKAKRMMSLDMFNNKAGGAEGGDGVAAGRRKRTTAAEEELEHSSFAARHLNTTAALTHLQLKFFHRPTLSRQALSSVLHKKPNIWHIYVEKRSNKHKLTASQGNLRRTQNSTKQIYSAAELSLTDDTSEYICIEYIEEHPSLIMNRGMASKIVNYYRPVESQDTGLEGEGDEGLVLDDGSRGGGADGADSSSKTAAGSMAVVGGRRVPRHLQQLRSGGGRGVAFGGSGPRGSGVGDIDVPKLKEGVTEVLERGEDFPFLGEISPGAAPQSCLHCDLFRAPLFPHEPSPTDFLLVRKSGVGGSVGGFQFVLKKLPTLFTSGQQEPLREVPTPKKKKALTPFQRNFMMFHIIKYFETHGEIDLSGVQKEFKYFWETFRADTKKALRRVAEEIVDHDDDTVTWVKKAPLTAKQLQKMQMNNQSIPFTIDDYMTVFSPEDVCIYEVATSAEYRLSLLGINYFMTQKQLEQVLNRFANIKKIKTNRLLKIKKMLRNVVKDQELKRFMPKSYKLNRSAEESRLTQEEKEEDDDFSRQIKNLNLLKDITEVELMRLKKKINVTRYIYEISLLTPWVLTSSFVKNHIEEQNKNSNVMKAVLAGTIGGGRGGYQKYSGLLRLTGIPGDPSGGVGEGYSYLTAVSKKAVKKDKNSTGTGSSTATIVGTGKDLRVLSMKDLETLCLQLGIKKDEIRILQRWDRVRVIQYSATEAKKLGFAQHLWRYAREEREGTQNLEEYKETCIAIWKRQAGALRDTTWSEAHLLEEEARLECIRRLTRQQRREKRAAQQARLAARAERKERREERALAKAAGEEVVESDGDAEEEEEEEEMDLGEESESSSSDDSDSESDMESDLNTDDEGDEEEGAAATAADDPTPVAAVASRRSKKAMALAKLNNTQEEKDLKFFEKLSSEPATSSSSSSAAAAAAAAAGGGDSGAKGTSDDSLLPSTREEHEQYWGEVRQRGGKVVKRVTRRILEDGTEQIEVRFIVDERDVSRVQEEERIAEVRERRWQRQLEEDLAMGRTPRRNSRGDVHEAEEYDHGMGKLGKKKKKSRSVDHVGDSYEDELGDETSSLTLKMSKYVNKAERHTNKVARQREQEEMIEEREYDRYHKKSSTNSRQVRGAGTYSQRSTVSQQRHLRLPHVLLAANLEIILCSIWNKKIASLFRAPVDLVAYPDYSDFVKQPISLQEIRDKIVNFSYHTVEAFVNDLKLMVSNSSLYNREGPITQNARKLCDEAIRRLAAEGGGYCDKDLSLMGKDSYGFYGQENDIKTTFSRIGRVFHFCDADDGAVNNPDLPDVMNPHASTGGTLTGGTLAPAITSPSPAGAAESSPAAAVNTSNLIPRRSLPTSPVETMPVSSREVELGELPTSSTDTSTTVLAQQQEQHAQQDTGDEDEEEEEEEVLEEG